MLKLDGVAVPPLLLSTNLITVRNDPSSSFVMVHTADSFSNRVMLGTNSADPSTPFPSVVTQL